MFDPAQYAPAFAALLSPDRLNPLDAGRPDRSFLARLEALSTATAFAPHVVRDENMATACRAALFLHYDFLDQSHALSQDLHTPEGSYWHGILHRREPDFDNAKYWFRRVGTHPVMEPLRPRRPNGAAEEPSLATRFLVEQPRWDPLAFVDLCEAGWPVAPTACSFVSRSSAASGNYCSITATVPRSASVSASALDFVVCGTPIA